MLSLVKRSILLGESLKAKLASLSKFEYCPTRVEPLAQVEAKEDRLIKAFFTGEDCGIRISKIRAEAGTVHKSYYQVDLPLNASPFLRQKFIKSSSKGVRVGRILELMDFMGATSAYRYLGKVPDTYFVTVCVDDIYFFGQILAMAPVRLRSYVSYVGKTSLQVQVDVLQEAQGVFQTRAKAQFLMAARNSVTSKSVGLPQLAIDSPDSKLRQDKGEAKKQVRKQEKLKNFRTDLTFKTSAKKLVPIASTQISKALLMHPQDKNLHGKVFGGFVMREAFELGWLCAHLFLGGQFPEVVYIDQIVFMSPVEVGSMVNFKARIVLAKEGLLHCVVECHKVDPKSGQQAKTNDFKFTFRLDQDPEKQVLPANQSEALQVLQAHRAQAHLLTEHS